MHNSRMLKVLVIVVIVVVLLAAALLKLLGPDIAYETLEAKYGGSASRFADMPGGLRVHYQDEGDAARPLLLLLHGFGDSHTTWDGWVRALEGRFHIIRLDFPGHGLTRAPAGWRLRGDELADFVDAFAAQLALPKFAVAGSSMGGAVAWQLALRHPRRFSALMLVDAVGFANEKPAALPKAFKILSHPFGRAIVRNMDTAPLVEAGLKFDVYDKTLITRAVVDRWAELQRAPGHRAILMTLDLGSLGQASAELLRNIDVPTLILHGEHDALIEPAAGRKFAAAIPAAQLVLYPHVGHLPQIEIPQRSAADAAEFLLAAR